jgi:hypothetical protein
MLRMGSEYRVTRRALLRHSGYTAIAVTASALFPLPATAAAPVARRVSWEQHDLPLSDTPLISPALACDFPFNAVESRWDADVPDGAALALSIRARRDGDDWGDWLPLHADDHAPDGAEAAPFGDLVIVAPATLLQYRVAASPGEDGAWPVVRSFSLAAVDTLSDDAVEATTHVAAATGVKIVPRAGWGADERLRFDKDGAPIWTPEYRAVRKVVIHHTVTDDPDPNPRATIRAIYQYHAVTRGWGDIGYNFLIDPNGTIYEGRYGGDGVIGGHTYGYNEGSLGIAMLGTYSTHTISAAARAALKALIRAKAGGLDPMGKGFFIDRENVWNVSGHRALTETDCPGDRFYPTFNNLRRELKGLPLWTGSPASDPLAANPPDATVVPKARPPRVATPATPAPSPAPTTMRAVLTSVAWPTGQVRSGDAATVRITLKNTGTATLPAGTPPPSTVYTEGEMYTTRGFTIPHGAFNVALGPAAKPNGPPYRWLPERDIRPGETVTFAVTIRPRTEQETPFIVTLRREGFAVLDQSAPHTLVVVAKGTDGGG